MPRNNYLENSVVHSWVFFWPSRSLTGAMTLLQTLSKKTVWSLLDQNFWELDLSDQKTVGDRLKRAGGNLCIYILYHIYIIYIISYHIISYIHIYLIYVWFIYIHIYKYYLFIYIIYIYIYVYIHIYIYIGLFKISSRCCVLYNYVI